MPASVWEGNQKRYEIFTNVRATSHSWRSAPSYREEIAVEDSSRMSVVGPKQPGICRVAKVAAALDAAEETEFGSQDVNLEFTPDLSLHLTTKDMEPDFLLCLCRSLMDFMGTEGRLSAAGDAKAYTIPHRCHKALGVGSKQADELLVAAARRHRRVREQLKGAIRDPTADDFEHRAVRVFRPLDSEAIPQGRTGDGGVDAEAAPSVRGLTSVRTKVQATQWGTSVSPAVVQRRRGALMVGASGPIVTTAHFTSGAQREPRAARSASIGSAYFGSGG